MTRASFNFALPPCSRSSWAAVESTNSYKGYLVLASICATPSIATPKRELFSHGIRLSSCLTTHCAIRSFLSVSYIIAFSARHIFFLPKSTSLLDKFSALFSLVPFTYAAGLTLQLLFSARTNTVSEADSRPKALDDVNSSSFLDGALHDPWISIMTHSPRICRNP